MIKFSRRSGHFFQRYEPNCGAFLRAHGVVVVVSLLLLKENIENYTCGTACRWTGPSAAARADTAATITVVHHHYHLSVPWRTRARQLSSRQGRQQDVVQWRNPLWVWPRWLRQSYSRSAFLPSVLMAWRRRWHFLLLIIRF